MFYTVESTVTFAIYSELSLSKLNDPSRLVLHLGGKSAWIIHHNQVTRMVQHI